MCYISLAPSRGTPCQFTADISFRFPIEALYITFPSGNLYKKLSLQYNSNKKQVIHLGFQGQVGLDVKGIWFLP